MITQVLRITWAKLFEAAKTPSGDYKFSCSLLISKEDKRALKELNAAIDQAIDRGKEKLWTGKVPKFRYEPLRDGDEELAEGTQTGQEYINHFFINCGAKDDDPPGVVGPDAKPLMNQRNIYSGCFVRADISAFPYKKAGNCGVGWYLNNVMLVKEGPRLDGKMKAEDAFSNFVETTADEMDETETPAATKTKPKTKTKPLASTMTNDEPNDEPIDDAVGDDVFGDDDDDLF